MRFLLVTFFAVTASTADLGDVEGDVELISTNVVPINFEDLKEYFDIVKVKWAKIKEYLEKKFKNYSDSLQTKLDKLKNMLIKYVKEIYALYKEYNDGQHS